MPGPGPPVGDAEDTQHTREARAAEDLARLGADERWIARFCLSVLGVLSTGSLIGVAFSLYLVNHFPLLLVAISPIGRHLILVAPSVDPVAFVVVVALRRMLFYLACFYLGRALGPAGIVWLEARAARAARWVRWLEGLFSRASRSVVLLMAGPTTSALAGTSGMSLRTYLPLAVVSLVYRLTLLVFFAEWLRGPIEALLVWIDEYWFPGTLLLVAGVALHLWRRRRSGPSVFDPPL